MRRHAEKAVPDREEVPYLRRTYAIGGKDTHNRSSPASLAVKLHGSIAACA